MGRQDRTRLQVHLTDELVSVLRVPADAPEASLPPAPQRTVALTAREAERAIEQLRRRYRALPALVQDHVDGGVRLLPAIAPAPLRRTGPGPASDDHVTDPRPAAGLDARLDADDIDLEALLDADAAELLELGTDADRPDPTALAELPAADRGLVVIGGNVGAASVLPELLRTLPAALDAPVIVHLVHADWGRRALLRRLRSCSVLPVEELRSEQELRSGVVYLAPPVGQIARLRARDGRWFPVVAPAPEQPGLRYVDALLEDATALAGARTVAVALSGVRADGTAGARWASAAGGTVLVQDPATVSVRGTATILAEQGIADRAAAPHELGPRIGDALRYRATQLARRSR